MRVRIISGNDRRDEWRIEVDGRDALSFQGVNARAFAERCYASLASASDAAVSVDAAADAVARDREERFA